MSYYRRTLVELAESNVLIEVDETNGKVELIMALGDGDPPLHVNLNEDQPRNHVALRRIVAALQEVDDIVTLRPGVEKRFSQAQPRAFVPAAPGNGEQRGLADGTD